MIKNININNKYNVTININILLPLLFPNYLLTNYINTQNLILILF